MRDLLRELWRSIFRHGRPTSDRSRSEAIFHNLFLHLHATRTHLWSLRPRFTLGLGVLSAASLLTLTVTGVLLMFYYKPSITEAYDSIKDLHYVVPTGRFIRNIHRWSAHVMVVAVLLHMARVFYTGAYKQARQFNWVVGMLLLVLTLGLSFTGYLLPWDQLAYWAVTIGANIAQSPRELTDALGVTAYFDPGGLNKTLLLGSTGVGPDALIRFHLLHVMILPIMLFGLVGVHFWRIRKDGGLARPPDADAAVGPPLDGLKPVFTQKPQKSYGLMALVRGTSPAVGRGPENTVPSWPHLLWAELAVLMLSVALVMVLAFFWDAPLKEAANPLVPENPAKAPWYFLGLQELVSFSAFIGGVAIPAITILGLLLIPYVDREPTDEGRWLAGSGERPIALWSAIYGLATVIGVEAVAIRFGWLRTWFPNIPQAAIMLVNPATVLTVLYGAFSLVIMRRARSTRLAAVALFTCFLCGFVVLTIIGVHFRGPNWGFYWSPSQWPGH
jgi:quinol-cytochrome oxidoreductase complex cytochrome b subunit